jgi:hypothetical protein
MRERERGERVPKVLPAPAECPELYKRLLACVDREAVRVKVREQSRDRRKCRTARLDLLSLFDGGPVSTGEHVLNDDRSECCCTSQERDP